MKKRILLFTAIAGFGYIIFSSSAAGPSSLGFDCTGAETALGNVSGCAATGSSCHASPPGSAGSATPGITVSIELDSAGVPTTHYKRGITYTVKLTGTNTTSNTLPKFGFQVSCIKGSVALATPVNAGTFAVSGLPAGVHNKTPVSGSFVCDLIEHDIPLSATTLGGAMGGTYVVSFSWTSPSAGTGPVSFWAALNAVNGDAASSSADNWNTNKLLVNEWPAYLSVVDAKENISIKAFPNPVSNNLNLQLDNADPGNYSIQAFDLNGKVVANQQIEVSAGSQLINIGTLTWTPGLYQVVVEKDGDRQVIPVVKQ